MTTNSINNLGRDFYSFADYCDDGDADFLQLSEGEKYKEYVNFCLGAGYKYEILGATRELEDALKEIKRLVNRVTELVEPFYSTR